MLKASDPSGAFASRFITFNMTKSFYGRENHRLTDRLLGELPGILNWAIEGWERLRERGHFIQPASGMQRVRELHNLTSPLLGFIGDQCVVEADRQVECQVLFQAYCNWCAEKGFDEPPNVQMFGSLLQDAVPGVEVSQRRVEGKRVRVYLGIGLK